MSGIILCLLFKHQFGEWLYVEDGSCQQERVCKRDAYKEKRTLHQYGEWVYIDDGSCEQERVCKRDGCREKRIQHDWDLHEEKVVEHFEPRDTWGDNVILLDQDEYEAGNRIIGTETVGNCKRCRKRYG